MVQRTKEYKNIQSNEMNSTDQKKHFLREKQKKKKSLPLPAPKYVFLQAISSISNPQF